jgi:acetyl-CoA C-acetyltransferase
MREAVVVSTARTGIERAFKGAFNAAKSPSLLGQVLSHAVRRAQMDASEVEDAVIGTVLSAGTAGMNVARNGVFAAGLPQTVAAQTIDRQCASGLMAIATAAKQIVADGMEVVVAGGQENISAVQNAYFDWVGEEQDPRVVANAPAAYMPMLQTAEFVASKYKISCLCAGIAASHRGCTGAWPLRCRDRRFRHRHDRD